MKTKLALWGLLAFGLGCSGTYESAAMKVRWELPRGVKLLEEQAGPPRVARFSDGVEIREVQAAPPAIEEGKLEELLPKIGAQAGVATTGNIISARLGDLPPGKVVRWTLKDGDKRGLVYFLPSGKRFLVISLMGAEGHYAQMENQFELSLSSLRVRD